jgi:protease-4
MNRKGLWGLLLLFGFLASIFFLCVLLVASTAGGNLPLTGVGLGVVEVTGPITDSREVLEQLQEFEDNDNIKGVLLRIDSPGGAVAPSQEMYGAVLRLKKKKKVVVSMGNLAASGGYYIACAGDRIFANPGTVTGSIGVITQLTNFSELADLAKVDVVTVKSGRYKDMGNPFRPFEEDDRQVFQDMVLNIYEQFIRDVAKSRNMKLERVREIADGRVYTGEQAKELGLVDELGGIQEAAEYLNKEAGLEGRPQLIYPPKEEDELFQKLLQGSARSVTRGVMQSVEEETAPRLEYRYTGPR